MATHTIPNHSEVDQELSGIFGIDPIVRHLFELQQS